MLGIVVDACNHGTQVKQEDCEFKSSLAYRVIPCIKNTTTKKSYLILLSTDMIKYQNQKQRGKTGFISST